MNFSNISEVDLYLNRDDDARLNPFAQCTVMIIVGAVGIICNIFIIVLALKYTERKNLHYLIINMAVSDIIFIFTLVFETLKLSSFWQGVQPFLHGSLGGIVCNITVLTLDSSYVSSLITLLVISIGRFRATRKTLQRLQENIYKKTTRSSTFCLLVYSNNRQLLTFTSNINRT